MSNIRKIITIIAFIIVILAAVLGGAISDRIFGYKILNNLFPSDNNLRIGQLTETSKILNEESVVIDVAEAVSPSVVTISISTVQNSLPGFDSFPFYFGIPDSQQTPQPVEQDIATGFILSADGLIVTNKHVVSDTEAKYKVITKDDKSYDVQKIYRDPVNDIALLKIDSQANSGKTLKPVELGDSSNLKVGQFVIAIGTALGEFRHTVTTGVVSGIGRSITAGSPFEASEQLDNVIQTDAAINPGNSGGPLINSAGQVIGVNVAVSQSGQGIGFALPINLIKDSVNNFNQTGQFSRPYLGIRYQMISKEAAIVNEVPQGAYLSEVLAGSPAENAGLERGDIITKIDSNSVSDAKGGLAEIISKMKVGQTVQITYYRGNSEKTVSVTLKESQ
jgi:serine protease Do